LGGSQTDLSSRAFGNDRQLIPGLFASAKLPDSVAAASTATNALEGTFLGNCIFSGRAAGRAAADAL
jgi:uncharacterized protein